MECCEAALKTSFRKEMGFKTSPQEIPDDFWMENAQNVVSGDEFLVEEFLDLSNENGFLEKEPEEEKVTTLVSIPHQKQEPEDQLNNKSTTNFEFESLPADELPVPAEDVENLEWLSQFVEDSFSEHSPAFPAGIFPLKLKSGTETRSQPENPGKTPEKTSFPAKARSKRTRTGGRIWSLAGSTTESSSSASSSSSSGSPSSSCLIDTNSVCPGSGFGSPGFPEKPPPVKKQKKKPVTDSAGATRRCSHCGVTKTPQWRAGPNGAKTLCNACGVRFKSNRLLPEYRPACSPTFSRELHSNHHRKVLEMRRKKEDCQPESPMPPPAVSSF